MVVILSKNNFKEEKHDQWLWLALVIFFGIWTLFATVIYNHIAQHLQTQFELSLFSYGIKLLIWDVPVIFLIGRVRKQNVLTELKLTSKPFLLPFIAGIVLGALYFPLNAYFVHHGSIFSYSFNNALSVLIAPILEETLFRGFLLIEFLKRMSLWRANIITSLLFVLVHWPYWIISQGLHMSILISSFNIFALSLFLGYALKKTNSLWPPIFIHFLNNLVAGL